MRLSLLQQVPYTAVLTPAAPTQRKHSRTSSPIAQGYCCGHNGAPTSASTDLVVALSAYMHVH